MSDLYPQAPVEPQIEPQPPLDKDKFAADYIRFSIEGSPEGYFKNKPFGSRLGEIDKISLALKEQCDGHDDFAGAKAIAKGINDESEEMSRISPADFSTAIEFKAELAKKTKYLDSVKYYDGLKAHKGVSTFSELKQAYTATID